MYMAIITSHGRLGWTDLSETTLFPIIHSWHQWLCADILSQKFQKKMTISNDGTFPNKIWLGSDWSQPSLFYLYSHKEKCDSNKNKQYRNFIPTQYTESFKHHLEGIYILHVLGEKQWDTVSFIMAYIGPGDISAELLFSTQGWFIAPHLIGQNFLSLKVLKIWCILAS